MLLIKRTFTDLQHFLANPISKQFAEIVCHSDESYLNTCEKLEPQGLNCILQVNNYIYWSIIIHSIWICVSIIFKQTNKQTNIQTNKKTNK